MPKVRIPTPLRSFTAGKDEVTIEGLTVEHVIANLDREFHGMKEKLIDANGHTRRFINIFVNELDIRSHAGLNTAVNAHDVISIFPAIAGGGFHHLIAKLQNTIAEVSAEKAKEVCTHHPHTIILDVRELNEWNDGHIPNALHLPRGFLEMQIEHLIPEKTTPIICQCASGKRSLLAANTLKELGYTNISSLAGGIKAWKESGFSVEQPKSSALSEKERTRYSRHLLIPEVGEEGQLKLLRTKVLLVGAGGLGSPAAYYLAAAGVGTIGIIDFDVVDMSNLQRQILHTTDRIGRSKVDSAQQSLRAINPDINIVPHALKLTKENAVEIFTLYDIIVDGSDNFATRYLVNDTCVLLKKPNVHGSVYRFEGQVSIFWPGKGPCYRCLYPEPPPPELAPSCADAGVLGVLPGVIGLLEAVETIKIILEQGNLLVGRLLCYDALRAEFRELKISRDPHCAYCGEGKTFPGFIDYQELCRV